MPSIEVELIRQLARTLRKVWIVHGTGDAFASGEGSDLAEDVRAGRSQNHPRGP
jgi:hypothetical protein